MNEGLFSAFEGRWKKLLELTAKPGCSAVYEIAEGERAFLAAALNHKTGRPVVLLCPTELAAQRHAQDVERLTGQSCSVLPPRDLQFSRAASSRESTWQRLKTLDALCRGESAMLCLSVDSLVERCAPKAVFMEAEIALSEGEVHPPEELMNQLLHSGYERVPMVEGCGQCAMRGSILDVFPANETEAVRVEFFDDEVDSIRRFDCISQRSINRVKSVRIAPASECLMTDPAAAAQRLKEAIEAGVGKERTLKAPSVKAAAKPGDNGDALPTLDDFFSQLDAMELTEDMLAQAVLASTEMTAKPTPDKDDFKRHLDDVERVRAGQTIRTAPMWMNVLCDSTVSSLAYLNNPILLCDRPDQFTGRLKVLGEEFEEAFEDARLRGDAFEAQRSLRFVYDELVTGWNSLTVIAMSDMRAGLGMLKPTEALSFGSKPPMPYQSQIVPLCKDIAQWKEQGLAIVLLTGGEARGLRLQKALAEQGVPSSYCDALNGNIILREVVLLPVSYNKGFIDPEAHLCLIGDTDIFGTAYHRARKKQTAGERIASFTDLKTGDYVVHDLHGVGIYQGVVQMENDGVKRDYLRIQYAGSDKLYVPADQFDRVQKFIGAEHAAPKLNHLGGGEWEKQKSKVKAGLKKLAFDLAELYARRSKNPGYAFSRENPWQQEFEDAFPYELTADQQQCVAQIESDMESPHNMDRLLCGDVGYGKTEVALRAAFKAVVEGKQVALLAPTTILVQQHYNTIKKRFSGFPVNVDMLSRFRTPAEQKVILQKLKDGELEMVIGTHRLLAKDVQFKDLGLLIVDEEHRFGVNHKEAIKNMKDKVDVLTLSATPIPRTLHMSMVGIRDMSLLETPPEERLPVKTYVMEYDDSILRDAIRRELQRNGQVYFLYNRVRSIEQMRERLQTLVPEARIGIAHGQMRENALEDVMLDFYAGAYDVLLCTTIVESGLDVPDANTLIVFDADHFGLSQLYQIRGRVGRSNRQAYAYFTVRANHALSETAEKRLNAIQEFTEFGAGYRIAMRDLEIRGAGDVLGPEQSGHLSTVGYDMYVKLIEQAVGEAQGKEQLPELDTRVELKLNAFLPESYVPQEQLRVEIYKRIAMVENEEGRLSTEEELIDRFGDIPEPVENLIRIAQLRGVTRKLGVSHLFLRQDGLHLRMDEHYMPDPGLLYEAVTKADARLRFSIGKVPELVLCQTGMNAEDAIKIAIPVLGKVHDLLAQHAVKPY
ncbi:MAG: transcription-repair coupling factor [Eubacteriales bacterium]|nr:transcription-repair coupling factor [Eubacteriales bacterium]